MQFYKRNISESMTGTDLKLNKLIIDNVLITSRNLYKPTGK